MRGFKRFVKRAMFLLLGLVGLLALVFFGSRAYLQRQGNRELTVIKAKLDADDPGWRLDTILARREQQPILADQDAVPFVLQAFELYQPERELYQHAIEWGDFDHRENHTPRFDLLVRIAVGRNPSESARTLAREQLLSRASGRYPLTMKDNPYLTLLPHLEKVRGVASLLEYDAMLAALEGDPARGVRSARSGINLARSVGDEPFFVSQLVRMAVGNVASRSAMRVFAWSELNGPTADAQLANLQLAFRTEADTKWFEIGVRGERASIHAFFDGLESERIKPDEMTQFLGCGTPVVFKSGVFELYRGFLPGDHAEAIRIMTAYLEITGLPHHEQRVAYHSVKFPPKPPEGLGYAITHLIVPACGKIGEAGLRCRAELLCASVGIACERFRLQYGRWPQTLEEIPKEILPEIPLDPYDGEPIRFRTTHDGVAIFSIGPDGLNPSDHDNRPRTWPFNGLGLGWRLYNPNQRGLPPDYRRPLPEFQERTEP